MTLLGVPDSFQMGVASSAAPSSSMDVSLGALLVIYIVLFARRNGILQHLS